MIPWSNTELTTYCSIIPSPHHYAYFAQFDWLKKKFSTSINSMSRNPGTIFLPPAQKMCNDDDKNKILMTKLELQRMNNYFCGFYRCVNSGESLTNFI